MGNNLSRRTQAEIDLEEIWLFIAADNIAAADRLLDRIGSIFEMLAENPLAGRLRPELASAASRSGIASSFTKPFRMASKSSEYCMVPAIFCRRIFTRNRLCDLLT
jgi:toxin ParE1/3/4